MKQKHLSAVLLVVLFSLFAAAQEAHPLLTVSGKVPTPLTFSQEEWAKLARATVSAPRGHGGTMSVFEGVPLRVLLERAGVLNAEKELRGKALLQYVVISAKDGYRVLFSLAELDAATGATSNVLLADKVDGKPLSEHEAPLQLVVATDKRPARAVRMVTSITVGSAE